MHGLSQSLGQNRNNLTQEESLTGRGTTRKLGATSASRGGQAEYEWGSLKAHIHISV